MRQKEVSSGHELLGVAADPVAHEMGVLAAQPNWEPSCLEEVLGHTLQVAVQLVIDCGGKEPFENVQVDQVQVIRRIVVHVKVEDRRLKQQLSRVAAAVVEPLLLEFLVTSVILAILAL